MKSMKKMLSCILALAMAAGMYTMPVYADEADAETQDSAAVETENAENEDEQQEETDWDAAEADADGFVIENGVLKGYTGTGGDVVIPYGVTSINLGVFKGNTKVRTVTMPDTVTKMNSDEIYGLGGVTNAEKGTFLGCKNLISVKLSKNLTCIGPGAFRECTSLKSIDIPDSVTEIGRAAFYKSGVEDVTFGKNLTTLYAVAFANSNIKKADLPSKLTSIGQEAFAGCKALTSVSIPDSITDDSFKAGNTGYSTFVDCTSLKSIKFSKNMTTIPEKCFKGCTGLTDLVLPSNILHLESQCFSSCKSLVNVDLGNIQSYCAAFPYCPSIKELILPNTLTTITKSSNIANWGAFSGMTGVEVLQIPSQFSDISKFSGDWGFENCFPALKTLYINKNTVNFGDYDFKGSPLLRDIYYTGSSSDWNSKVVYNNPDIYLVQNMDYYIIHCSDIDIVGKKTKSVSEISASLKWGYEIKVGDDLDLSKIEITVKYNNNTTNVITAATDSVNVKGYNKAKSGKQTLTITYEGKSTTLTINVKADAPAKTVKSISLIEPTQNAYTVGDSLDVSGGFVNVQYSDNSSETISLTSAMCSGFNPNKTGTQTITVTYEGKKATFTVTVMNKPIATLDDTPIESISAALKGLKSGEHTIFITSPVTEKTITIPKNLTKVTIICDGGVTLTTNTITANSPLVLDDVTISGVNPAKPTVIKANSDFSANSGTFGNVTIKGKAELSDITINGTLKLAAKANGSTDTLEYVTITKKVTTNNNIVFENCPEIGAVTSKGTVTVEGNGTKAVSIAANAKTGESVLENVTVEKKVTSAGNLKFIDCPSIGTVTAKGTVTVEGGETSAVSITANAKEGESVLENVTVDKKITVKDKLTVNGTVKASGAISCAELNSTDGAELTFVTLAVTKTGITKGSAKIELVQITKKGETVDFTPGKKDIVVVKTFKPKNSDISALSAGGQELVLSGTKVIIKKVK